ncbi:MAG: aminotransferase class V-fold PLP-dependent enzyme [Bacteroidetes bacterium]|nr:MAG: aminotransferase class V-fold PLP-dependent enzyme [Bacteroidota bacterium]
MLTCQKHRFSLPEDLHYLNSAYMSPLLRQVEAAGIAGIRRKRNPATIDAADFFEESDRVRERFAALVNAPDPSRIALIPSASYGLATAAQNLPVSRGARIVVAGEQFPSNVYPWRRLAAERGAVVHTVPAPAGPERGRRWNERLLDAITPGTAIVALGHVHWTDGTRFDLERIGGRAREVGAALVVDGTQSVGALPFDVQALQPDALVCAGYKWLMGPYSLGVAYFGPRFDDGRPLEENWITRRGSEVFSGLVDYVDAYQPGAVRYDVGERSNFILVPMLRAALDQLADWGVAAIQDYGRRLSDDLIAEARTLGYAVEDAAWRSAHLVGLRLPPGRPRERLLAALAARNVVVSVRGEAIRVSAHVYNDEDDMQALQDALHAAAG